MSFPINRRQFIASAGALAMSRAPVADAWASNEGVSPDFVRDVIVVGAGGAGLAAAIEAADAGASVVVLEKMPVAGGNTFLADAFNAVDPVAQKKIGVTDSVEHHFRQMMESGEYRADPDLAKLVAYGAPDTLDWLKEKGVEFSPDVYQVYSSLWPRTHNPIRSFGLGYVEPLRLAAVRRGVDIRVNTRVTALLREEALSGRVLGVTAENTARPTGTPEHWVARRGVVIASGGFGAAPALIERFDPLMKGLRTTNHAGATGDMIAPLEDIGAATVGMEFIQLLPGGSLSGRFIGAISPIENMILVDRSGHRFVAEDAAGCRLTNAVLRAPGQCAVVILDARGYAAQKPSSKAAFDAGMRQGEAYEAATLNELALKLRIPAENLKRTVRDYNRAVEAKVDPLGRNPNTLVSTIEIGPFYAARISMSVNCTLGGVAIDTKARVLDRRRHVIPGLFAAGEVTGGIHGETLMGGNSLSDVFTVGRLAGREVSKET